MSSLAGKHLPEDLVKKIGRLSTRREQLETLLDYMQSVLEAGKSPHFPLFWVARRACLPFFRADIGAEERQRLWYRYKELCHEANQLRILVDEEQEYVVDQIQRAVDAIERDLVDCRNGKLQPMTKIAEPIPVFPFQKHYPEYVTHVTKLYYLKTFICCLKALRKEVTGMVLRFRQQAGLLRRFRILNDDISKAKRECIDRLGERFRIDVQLFVSLSASSENLTYSLRDAIRDIERFSQYLTLSSSVFFQTRKQLHMCLELGNRKIHAEKKKRHKRLDEGENALCLLFDRWQKMLDADRWDVHWRRHLVCNRVLCQDEQSRFDTLCSLFRDREEQELRAMPDVRERLKMLYDETKAQLEQWKHTYGAMDFGPALIRHDLIEKERGRLKRLESELVDE